jgi:cell division protein FtsW
VTSTAEPRRAAAVADAIGKTLQRPLASYHLVLGSSLLLLGLGLVMVLSASSVRAHEAGGNSYGIFARQALFAVLGLIGGYIAFVMPLENVKKLSGLALVGATGLVLLTFIPGVGMSVNGNTNWLQLSDRFALQPSEFAKFGLVLWISTWYCQHQRGLNDWKAMCFPVLPVAGGVAMLVVLQKDLGTALVLFAITGGMLWSVGLPRRQLAALGSMLAVVLVFFVAIAPHRVARLMVVFNPLADPDSTGYQSVHAMMALATGGFWGVGLGGSRQKWGSLPYADTDFILAIVGEELGLVGTVVVLALFVMLIVAGVRVAMRTRDTYAHFLATGITVWIAAQAMINIGMVLGLLPVIGIPLPLMSYGGSSLLVTIVALGLLANCSLTEPGARRARAAGRRVGRANRPALQRKG